MKKGNSKFLLALGLGLATAMVPTQLLAKKPNILVICRDRYWLVQYQSLYAWYDGISNSKY